MPEPEVSYPALNYPEQLPVSEARDRIVAAIAENQVVIVAGATGSGKTTQLPKMCLEAGGTRIAHTQPRRIAARTIAERIAQELQVPLGSFVGYTVRFTDTVSEATRIRVMTEGILLNEIHRDRMLERYDTIIIDEAHERSLNVDFLIGYLKRILPRRPDLRVVITSATIDPVSFAEHFAGPDGTPAPIIEVSGRTYPVEVRYRPDPNGDNIDGIVAALRELESEPNGDVLVFLPGEAEIRDAVAAIRGAYAQSTRPVDVLPLFGRLSSAEQHRVFEPSRVAGVARRVIVATNVAETSLTVPGIRYVIDTGTARMSRYSTRSKIQRLPIEPISQASAQQRAGRAGRTAPGVAIRLYAESDFAARDAFTDPEVLRTNLAAVLLQMLALGFGEITDFPFLTPPDSRGVKAATDLLLELGAVRAERGSSLRLTELGRKISRLPIDPRFGRMLVQAERTGVLSEVLPIVAGLSIQDVRERPEEQREQADAAHRRFADPGSDFLSLLNLWNYLQQQQRELGSSAFRRRCRSEFLNYVRVREWWDVHRQLSALLTGSHGKRGKNRKSADQATGTADPDSVHRAILSGLLGRLGVRDDRTVPAGKKTLRQYRGSRGTTFQIFPGSVLARKQPDVVMAGELVETSRLFARTVAKIDPAWAEDLAGDLAHRTVFEPHWSRSAGAASAYQKVTLFGVELIPRRRVQLARSDRPLAREMFLRHALVEGQWDPTRLGHKLAAFDRANTELRQRLEQREERERRRDILVGDQAVYDFYHARIPAEVYDVRSFQTWWRQQLQRNPSTLEMTEADLTEQPHRSEEDDFPGSWQHGDQRLTLAYRFDPGAPDDGVTAIVPLALLAQLQPVGFDWQVPGLRHDLITALIRALPKPIRRHVVPAAQWAQKLEAELAGSGPEHSAGMPDRGLLESLAARIQHVAGQPVTPDDFEQDRVPAHLRITFRAVDDSGATVDSDRDLRALQSRCHPDARASVAHTLTAPGNNSPEAPESASPIERSGLTSWSFGDLDPVVDTRVPGGVVRGYPALVDEGTSVAIRIETTPEAALRVSRTGVRRLLLLAVPSPAGYVLEHLTAAEKLDLASAPYSSVKALIEDARAAVADAVTARESAGEPVRTEQAFTRIRDAFSAANMDELFSTVSLVARILRAARELERAVAAQNSMTLLAALSDVKTQLNGMIYPGFIAHTGTEQLVHLPRYLRAATERVTGLADNPGRDRQRMTEHEKAAHAYTEAGGTLPARPDDTETLTRARWQLEELRVSLFAQALGTAEPISVPRVLKTLRG